MNKKLLSAAIVLLGVALIAYGVVTAPISNESEIRKLYDCDRVTEDLRDTDVYCPNRNGPETAPEAKKNYKNAYVYAGVALVAIGGVYAVMAARQRKK